MENEGGAWAQTVPETGSYFDVFMADLTIQSLIEATSTVVTDIVNKETRSRMMAGIKGKDTKPELILRKLLHSNGFRYRLHVSYISGRPDIVLRRYQAVIFVHVVSGIDTRDADMRRPPLLARISGKRSLMRM